jgi:lipid-A-disaccharide synthase
MVNLVAGRHVVPELIQDQMTAERIAAEAFHLLEDTGANQAMRAGLAEVAKKLGSDRDPMEIAADWVERAESVQTEGGETVHAS